MWRSVLRWSGCCASPVRSCPATRTQAVRAFIAMPTCAGSSSAGSPQRARSRRQAVCVLRMHPSQFCVLATTSEPAAQNALGELEYHAEIMALMGYGGGWHPHGAHINVHGGARAPGIAGFRVNFARLSETARNLVTVENDEVSYGLDDLLPLGDTLPIVLDIYHHWIASRGEYIRADDARIAVIEASWRGVRPVSHVSQPREELLPDHDIYLLPDFAALTASGIKAKDLRAHSDLMWDEAVNDLVADHLVWTDFEVEAKFKNIASEGLARHVERRRGMRAESPLAACGESALRRSAQGEPRITSGVN